MLYAPAEVEPRPSQASKRTRIARIVNGFKLMLLNTFAESSIENIGKGPELIKCFIIHR